MNTGNWDLCIYGEFSSKLTLISLGKYLWEPEICFVWMPLWCFCVLEMTVCTETKTAYPSIIYWKTVTLKILSMTIKSSDHSHVTSISFLSSVYFFGLFSVFQDLLLSGSKTDMQAPMNKTEFRAGGALWINLIQVPIKDQNQILMFDFQILKQS